MYLSVGGKRWSGDKEIEHHPPTYWSCTPTDWGLVQYMGDVSILYTPTLSLQQACSHLNRSQCFWGTGIIIGDLKHTGTSLCCTTLVGKPIEASSAARHVKIAANT